MDIKVITIPVGPLKANCYIVYSDENDKLLVIDPGGDFSVIENKIKSLNKSGGAVLLTHAHFDHIMATSEFQNAGFKIYMHKNDMPLLEGDGNLAKYLGLKLTRFSVDNELIGGLFDICGFRVEVIETPGHTAGSVCYKIANILFSGDTIFKESFGRFDFPSGNLKTLVLSIKKLFAIQENLVIYSGHGEVTTLDAERNTNAIYNYF
ncbi:MAG: MBL fold metallo-hydrolase [Clostridia bacterium]|nr:MBL fold metallo-hydrolase [Clostridia bacterium]